MNTTYLLPAVAGNLVLTIWMAVCLVHDFDGSRAGKEVDGVQVFRYFTIDSNLLMALTALLTAVTEILALAGGLRAVPGWMRVLKYVATCAVTLTMLTVLFFLGPTQGYRRMLSGDNLYLHLIGPLIAIAVLCVFERGANLPFADTLIAVIPTLIYGCVYFALVVLLKKWPDFYGFNVGGRWYLSVAAVLTASWGIGLLIRFLYNL